MALYLYCSRPKVDSYIITTTYQNLAKFFEVGTFGDKFFPPKGEFDNILIALQGHYILKTITS